MAKGDEIKDGTGTRKGGGSKPVSASCPPPTIRPGQNVVAVKLGVGGK